MTYSTCRADFVRVVQWLESDDEDGWLDQIDLLADTIFALRELTPPLIRQTVVPPEGAAICFATPQMIGMLAAMFGGERDRALELGQAILDILPESPQGRGGGGIQSESEAEALSYSER